VIWAWLVGALFAVLVIVIGWLMVEESVGRRRENKRAVRRRTAEERLAQAQERMERRRRLGLPDDDKRGLP
jgi:hypothetical protein